MNKTYIVAGVVVLLAIVGYFSFNNSNSASQSAPAVAAVPAPTASSASAATASSSAPLMASTGQLFSQYQYASRAHEVFPTPSADLTTTLGAFSYTKTDLGNNTYRITLTNNAEGYQGQSVTVSGDQKVYFIERSTGDDSSGEDSSTKDDYLLAVDAQGYVLQ